MNIPQDVVEFIPRPRPNMTWTRILLTVLTSAVVMVSCFIVETRFYQQLLYEKILLESSQEDIDKMDSDQLRFVVVSLKKQAELVRDHNRLWTDSFPWYFLSVVIFVMIVLACCVHRLEQKIGYHLGNTAFLSIHLCIILSMLIIVSMI